MEGLGDWGSDLPRYTQGSQLPLIKEDTLINSRGLNHMIFMAWSFIKGHGDLKLQQILRVMEDLASLGSYLQFPLQFPFELPCSYMQDLDRLNPKP